MSEIGEIATSQNKVTKQLYFPGNIYEQKKGNWEQMRGTEGVFLCLFMFAQNTKQVRVCVCVCVCERERAGTHSVAVISLVIYGCVSKDALVGP